MNEIRGNATRRTGVLTKEDVLRRAYAIPLRPGAPRRVTGA
jgi:hypothetical protein